MSEFGPRSESFCAERHHFLKQVGAACWPGELDFWSNALEGWWVDQGEQRLAGEFVFPQDWPLQRLTVLASPKPGASRSADVVVLKRHGLLGKRKAIFAFFGDGIRNAADPAEELNPLLETYDCLERPDALPGCLLQDPNFARQVFNHSFENPADFFARFQYCWQLEYGKAGLDNERLQELPNSGLPAMVGVAMIIDSDFAEMAMIGDPEIWGIDATGLRVAAFSHPLQNPGFDQLTRAKISRIIKEHPGMTVSQAKRTEEFQDWLVFTYGKINLPGGVPALNGKDFDPKAVMSTRIPVAWLRFLAVGSDGWTLGASSPPSLVRTLSQVEGSQDLSLWLEGRIASQPDGYRQDHCSQEKRHDDLVVGGFTFRNSLYRSEFAPMLFEARIEQVIPELLLPWQARTAQLAREGFGSEKVARQLLEEGYENVGWSRVSTFEGRLKIVAWWLEKCKSFDAIEERERIKELEQAIEDPLLVFIVQLTTYEAKRCGWTSEMVAGRVKEVFGKSMSSSAIRARVSEARRILRRTETLHQASYG